MLIVSASLFVAAVVTPSPEVAITRDGPAVLHARVRLPVDAADGVLSIEEVTAGPPDELVLEWVATPRAAGGTLDLFLNDERFAVDPGAIAGPGGLRAFRIADAGAIARAWRDPGPNAVRLAIAGGGEGVAWARVRVGSGIATAPTCLVDVGGGRCEGVRLRGADGVRGDFEVKATLEPGSGTASRVRVPLAASSMPRSVDLRSLSDGPHVLCVASRERAGCAPFDRDGELELRIEGSDATLQAPVAHAGIGSSSECTSPAGASVSLDGSASTGNIAAYEWFEGYGTPAQVLLGTGSRLAVTLPLGAHELTLRVTDAAGQVATATVAKAVVDTTPPVVRVVTTPATLWPADHRMVPVVAEPIIYDACGPTRAILVSAFSNEADYVPTEVQGDVSGDVQGVELGTNDRSFSLRAETGTIWGGRRYTITYVGVDASRNRSVGRAGISVKAARRTTDPINDPDKL